jgi:hypothetical protein
VRRLFQLADSHSNKVTLAIGVKRGGVMADHVAGGATAQDSSRANLALALAGAAAVLYILAVFVAEESNADWLWPVSAVVGGAGAITGWSAGTPRPRGRALAAVVLGGLIFAVVLLWVIVAAISGDL